MWAAKMANVALIAALFDIFPGAGNVAGWKETAFIIICYGAS